MKPDHPDATHVSIDIETLGTAPGSVILTIGAVAFNRHGLIPERNGILGTFYQRIDLDYSLRAGLTVDASTLRWWFSQPQATQDEVFDPGGDARLQRPCADTPCIVLQHLFTFLHDWKPAGIW